MRLHLLRSYYHTLKFHRELLIFRGPALHTHNQVTTKKWNVGQTPRRYIVNLPFRAIIWHILQVFEDKYSNGYRGYKHVLCHIDGLILCVDRYYDFIELRISLGDDWVNQIYKLLEPDTFTLQANTNTHSVSCRGLANHLSEQYDKARMISKIRSLQGP